MKSELSQPATSPDLRIFNRPTKRQIKFKEAYLNPLSDTFANVYQSAKASGFSDSTSRVLAANSRNTPWVQEVKQLLQQYEPEHIYMSLQQMAGSARADRDKIRSLELLAKIKGMFIERSQSEVSVTFSNGVPRPVVEGEVVPTDGALDKA